MSQPLDKITAVSGLAALVSEAVGVGRDACPKYYAGLWSRHLLLWMAWATYRPKTVPDEGTRSLVTWQESVFKNCSQPARSPIYRGPSWSWASNMGPMTYECFEFGISHPYKLRSRSYQGVKTRTTVDHVECELDFPGNYTGPVRAGHMVLSGLIAPAQLVHLSQHNSVLWNRLYSGQRLDYTPQPELLPFVISDASEPVALVRCRDLSSYRVWHDFEGGPKMEDDDPTAKCWLRGACRCGKCYWNTEHQQTIASLFAFELFTWKSGCTVADLPGTYYPAEDELKYGPEISDEERYCEKYRLSYERRRDMREAAEYDLETWFLLLSRNQDGTYQRVGVGYAGQTCQMMTGDSSKRGRRLTGHVKPLCSGVLTKQL